MHTDRNLNAKNSTFITYFKQLRTNQRTQKSRNILPETTRPCNKRFNTHCKSMRNLEFFKSTNTNSQTLCNSEEPRCWESCIRQFASILRKDWKTRMLNWNTFSMWRLTIQKNSNFFESSLYASHLVQIIDLALSFVYQKAPDSGKIFPTINFLAQPARVRSEPGSSNQHKAGVLRWAQ
jgi:hypothetical protein